MFFFWTNLCFRLNVKIDSATQTVSPLKDPKKCSLLSFSGSLNVVLASLLRVPFWDPVGVLWEGVGSMLASKLLVLGGFSYGLLSSCVWV